MSANDEAVMNPVNNERTLLLHIDWSGRLQFGAQLSPTLTLMGVNLHSTPTVLFELDPRLDCRFWEEKPQIQVPNSVLPVEGTRRWEFTEMLTIAPSLPVNTDAVYRLILSVHFEEPVNNQLVPFDFQTTLKMNVTADHAREIIVEASENAVINTHNLDWSQFDKIVLRGDENALINLSKGMIPPNLRNASLESAQNSDPNPTRDSNILVRVPLVNKGGCLIHAEDRRRTLLLKVTVGNSEKLFHLIARQDVLLGRQYKESSTKGILPADIVYRFYRMRKGRSDRPEVILSELISRNHARISIEEDGIRFYNMSKHGLDLQFPKWLRAGKIVSIPRGRSEMLEWKETESPFNLLLMRIASLKVERLPISSDRVEELLKNQNLLGRDDSLWEFGFRKKMDGLRIRRQPDFLWGRKKELLDGFRSETDRTFFEGLESLWKKETEWKQDTLTNEEYFIIFRAITIGSNRQKDSIYINSDKIIENHASIYFSKNCFGITNYDTTAVNGRDSNGKSFHLFRGNVQTLTPGMTFDVGPAHFEVLESYAAYLRNLKEEQERSRLSE